MKPRRLLFALLLASMALPGSGLQAGKPTKPAPPPAPFNLTGSLNVITVELSKQLRAWDIDGDITQTWSHSPEFYARSIVLADVDGEGDNELVTPDACLGPDDVTYAFLVAFKQGKAGEYYSGRCDPDHWVAVGTSTQPEIAAVNLDLDLASEIVLRTQTDVVVFDLQEDTLGSFEWRVLAHRRVSDLRTTLGLTDGTELRSLAVGDIDGDSWPEIVTVLDYWTATTPRETKSWLVVLGPNLEIEASLDFSTLGLESFCAGYTKGLFLADTDGVGGKEVWLVGWTNDATATSYLQRILSFTMSGVGLSVHANWDLGWSRSLAPKVSAGRLLGSAHDRLIVAGREPGDYTVEVWEPQSLYGWSVVDGGTMTAPGFVHRMFVADDRLVLTGLLLGAKKVEKGLFLMTLDAANLNQQYYYGMRDGSEIVAVTLGPK